jgi:uncharacterized protein YndB with AHSA1/START domain
MDGSYTTVDGRPALVFERELAHPPEKVFHALTTPEELSHWFPARVAVDLRVGGAMTFTFPDGKFPELQGEVLELDPPRRFVFTWDTEELRFELEPSGGGCRLRFTHLLDDREMAARVAAGWDVCFDELDKRLAGEPAAAPGTEPTERHQELYEQYVERGLPHGATMPG